MSFRPEQRDHSMEKSIQHFTLDRRQPSDAPASPDLTAFAAGVDARTQRTPKRSSGFAQHACHDRVDCGDIGPVTGHVQESGLALLERIDGRLPPFTVWGETPLQQADGREPLKVVIEAIRRTAHQGGNLGGRRRSSGVQDVNDGLPFERSQRPNLT